MIWGGAGEGSDFPIPALEQLTHPLPCSQEGAVWYGRLASCQGGSLKGPPDPLTQVFCKPSCAPTSALSLSGLGNSS